ncbi:XRE family transcriptional regulator [Tenacibaculum ovolyticum]|uniref:XRE family transcriptional regulator n=1 Tax=Tenacibaculum ovolyticum TaxID=104270 RepID=UPI001F3F8F98|nr:XRE family transcriptional regulator [Tenacibaculum ovolyticum]
MKLSTINLREIKEMRLERHWSQDQLAEMSGLSIRTIQRIENGENAGLESLKSLAAVFETNIIDSDKNVELKQLRKEEAYIQNLKGFYKLTGIAVLSLVLPFILAINDSTLWSVFLWILLSWIVLIGGYSLNVFDFFGEEWKRKVIDSKFGNTKSTK